MHPSCLGSKDASFSLWGGWSAGDSEGAGSWGQEDPWLGITYTELPDPCLIPCCLPPQCHCPYHLTPTASPSPTPLLSRPPCRLLPSGVH